jgi:hypothetical protein
MHSIKKTNFSRYFGFWIFFSLILLAVVFLGLLDLSAKQQTAAMEKKSINILKNQILNSLESKITELKIEELFWQNRLKLAPEKEISLVIDMIDSLILLETNGVTLRQCKIKYYQKGPFVKEKKLLQWIAHPFTLQNDYANFSKEPIKEKTPSTIDTTTENPSYTSTCDTVTSLYFHLDYNRNLSLNILQSDLPYYGVWPDNTVEYIYNPNAKDLPANSKYWINLYLSRSDIIALYRALSPSCKLILRS